MTTTFAYGPAEVFVAAYRGELPDTALLGALTDLIASDTVRLLDLLLITKAEDGSVRVREIDDVTPVAIPGSSGPVELEARGLTANDDIDEVADSLEPGTSAAIVVIEQLWAKALAERFTDSGSHLLWSTRVPAPALNELAAAAHIG
ncbi:DUF6325 family protein [Curtobacterium sp. ZW137]|uniref:DUF6325 family protein n=1 Tax=Curtobacterium sp. ZW137 TaxID=2485104 RepID=UPI000F4B14E7|nr:DUF6325 family protein [Curtobacterium sp. ZW137]ROP66096.1 hypothetical protein EDF55_0546 [Curtobacterium sp. ZW137]